MKKSSGKLITINIEKETQKKNMEKLAVGCKFPEPYYDYNTMLKEGKR